MKIYQVGGAVRDQLMGIPCKDLDYVIVGSTPEELIALGYKQVGKDFPVFLHPETKDEYALARTEFKDDYGYHGFKCDFNPEITIEQDLARRDLKINAIAYDFENDKYIDPYGGILDIKLKILAPVSDAFREDPVRVLRAAKFMARFPDFTASPMLQTFCDQMFVSGELDYLTPERVWQETLDALNSPKPSRYFESLLRFRIFKELGNLWGIPQRPEHHPEVDTFVHTMMVIDHARETWNDPVITFACLLHDLGKAPCYRKSRNAHAHESVGLPLIDDLCDRFKIPNKFRWLASSSCEMHTKIHGCLGRGTNSMMKSTSIMKMFENTGAMRDPDGFLKILAVCESDAKGRGGDFPTRAYPQRSYLMEVLEHVRNLNTSVLTHKMREDEVDGKQIGIRIREIRVRRIKEIYTKWKNYNGTYPV